MENILLLLFIVLFSGRLAVRFVLEQINNRYLREHGKDIPAGFEQIINQQTLARMMDYSVEHSRLGAKESIVDDCLTLVVIFILLPVLVNAIVGLNVHLIWQALIFFGIFAVLGGIIGLPFDIYENFVLEKKYGFSTMTWRIWITDLIKTAIISAIMLFIIVGALMTFILYFKKSWWFWGWLFFTGFQILLIWLYPVVIAPLFNKYEPVKDEMLKDKITAMMEKAGLKTKGIFQVDEGKRSRHTNAYFTGIGKTKRIVLFDTLLASHSHEEILAVLAHEIGHWKKRHIAKKLIFMITGSLALLYGVYLAVNWSPLYDAFRLKQTPVYAGLFLISLYLGTAGFFLGPIAAAISRRYEKEADFMAWQLTGTAAPMVDALRRLAKDNLANLHPHPFYARFYYSHPPLVQRIEYLKSLDDEKMKKQQE
ncbi:MAG TPA: M48 family metallopeptidase [Smithellaceae bacterium]|nr:M48 family metallopeptidase [Smithellaceae bacterium]HRS90097.1 M48 family metallopeptidase [Smithellaceae bacterium]HRV26947.1 M48 family metallopeptidase [Smithellaceae bacterium]